MPRLKKPLSPLNNPLGVRVFGPAIPFISKADIREGVGFFYHWEREPPGSLGFACHRRWRSVAG